jgi:hypothetical protein
MCDNTPAAVFCSFFSTASATCTLVCTNSLTVALCTALPCSALHLLPALPT